MRSAGVKLGIFTVFTIFITMWLAAIIGNLSLVSDTYSVDAEFTDATGVLRGDLVKIAGVDIGKVTGFKVEDGVAVVTLEIAGDVELPANVLADIKYRNLLGQRVVNLLRPESPSSEPLEDGDTIKVGNTTAALDLSVVFNNLRPLIQSTNPDDINTVARAILEVFEGREQDLAGILGDVGELTQTLAGRDQRLARLVENLDEVTKILNRQGGSIRTGVGRFGELMDALADVTPSIERVIDQLDSASKRFGSILERNQGNLDQELADLDTVLGVVVDNLGPLDRIAKNLKEVLLATARSQSYGKWWNQAVMNLCPETPARQCPGLGGGARP